MGTVVWVPNPRGQGDVTSLVILFQLFERDRNQKFKTKGILNSDCNTNIFPVRVGHSEVAYYFLFRDLMSSSHSSRV